MHTASMGIGNWEEQTQIQFLKKFQKFCTIKNLREIKNNSYGNVIKEKEKYFFLSFVKSMAL